MPQGFFSGEENTHSIREVAQLWKILKCTLKRGGFYGMEIYLNGTVEDILLYN